MIPFARVSIPGSVLTLAVCDTLLLLGCFFLAAHWTQTADLDTYLFYGDGLLKIGIVVASLQLGLFLERLYEWLIPPSRLFQQMCLVLGAAFLLQSLLSYGNWGLELEREEMLYGSLLLLPVFPLWRIAFSALLSKAIPMRRMLFLGASPEIDRIAQQLEAHPEMGISVLGYLDSRPRPLALTNKLGSMDDFEHVIREHAPHRIVIGTWEHGEFLPVRRLLELQLTGTQVEKAHLLYESLLGRVSTFSLEPSRLIFSSEPDPSGPNVTLQNIYSMLLTVVLILATSPLMILTAILVKLSSRGPMLNREPRIGFGGAPLNLFLFRTHYAGRAGQSDSLTPVGRWLHRFHIEKLPLLFNIVRGEMTLVGPQPERPEFAAILEKLIPFYVHRQCVRPGLTGWAQIHTGDGLEDAIVKLEYDFYYIKNLAPSLDLQILLRALTH